MSGYLPSTEESRRLICICGHLGNVHWNFKSELHGCLVFNCACDAFTSWGEEKEKGKEER